LRWAEVLCSSQAGGGSLVPAAVQPRFRLVVAARGAPGPGSLRAAAVARRRRRGRRLLRRGPATSGGASRAWGSGTSGAAARGGVGLGQQWLYAPLGGL